MQPLSPSQTTCGSLLHELQLIWDEIGETDSDRDKMLLELEQECLDIYRKKVEKTRKHKFDLRQSLAEAETEIANLNSALGENAPVSRVEGTLKQQLSAINRTLDKLKSKKEERILEFSEILSQLGAIAAEISGEEYETKSAESQLDESDLTVKRLEAVKSYLLDLQNEKSLRLEKVNTCLNSIRELSAIMSFDFEEAVRAAHPSFEDFTMDQSKSISNDAIARLTSVVHTLMQEKRERLHKLRSLGSKLLDLWDLIDVSPNDRNIFKHVIVLLYSSAEEILARGCLGLDIIEQAEREVERLSVQKTSKMKELILKRQDELEEVYRCVHMDVDSYAAREKLICLIESGGADMSSLLSTMNDQLAKAKEEALSRKEVLEKFEKWKHALEEEKWLDEYEKDENRYSAGKGAHKNLKRAEKARVLVNKIPLITEGLIVKVKNWETERGVHFLYDKSPVLHNLEDYILLRKQKDEEKRLSREQKRLQGQLAAEQEALYGSKPATRKPLGQRMNSDNVAGTPIGRRLAKSGGLHGLSSGKERRDSGRAMTPLNFVALQKDDSISR